MIFFNEKCKDFPGKNRVSMVISDVFLTDFRDLKVP